MRRFSFQERIYKQKFSTNGPEARLYMSCLGGLLLPTGGLILSFAQGRGHWSGPAIGVVIIMTGIFTILYVSFATAILPIDTLAVLPESTSWQTATSPTQVQLLRHYPSSAIPWAPPFHSSLTRCTLP